MGVEGAKIKSRPLPKENVCYIYAIIHVQNGKIYVGRTIQRPYVRFQQHMKTHDPLGKAMLSDDSKFVVLLLEVLPKLFPCQVDNVRNSWHWRKRENAWIHKLNSHRNGYNTRREIVKPRSPGIPSHGFGIRPIKRSRREERISKANGGFHGKIMFLSRDWKRRVLYLAGLVNHRPHLPRSHISKQAPKNVRRMIKYVGQEGLPENMREAFKILRQHLLKSFPPPKVKKGKIPKLIVLGYTSEIANVLPLRGLLMRQNTLAHIPPSCQEFREINSKSTPCFKNGETLDRTFLNITAVGRDVEQNYTCICDDNNWSEYTVDIKDSSRCV